MKTLEFYLLKHKMNSKQYEEAVKRKDKQIEQLKKEREILLKTLIKKEQQITELNSIVKRCRSKLSKI